MLSFKINRILLGERLMINKITQASVSFKANFKDLFDAVPSLDERYTTPESRAKTVTILGSSKPTDEILSSMDKCSKITKDLIQSGYNIQTGCGAYGIMGSAYNAAKENSVKDIQTSRPLQNLAIIMEPAWGDEDLENCTPIGKSTSEADRIAKFRKTSNTFVVFPGSATTLQESVSLIQQNEYAPKNEPLKKIILVGKDFFDGLTQQYQKLFNSKLLKHAPEELFTVLDSQDEVLKEVSRFSKTV